MFKKITSEKALEMFEAYCKKQSDSYVAETCGIGRETVAKYRVDDKWEKRLKEINEKVQAKQDNDIASVKARHVKLIREWIAKFAKALKGRDRAELSASDYEKLAKLELLLLGEVTEREERVHSLKALKDSELDNIIGSYDKRREGKDSKSDSGESK